MHDEYARIAASPMDSYFPDVLDFILPRIDHGRICDLGAHALGHYWAAGYIERVNSYSCYDLSAEALAIFRATIDEIAQNPGYLRRTMPDLLDYLYDNALITAPESSIEQQLVAKLGRVTPFNFLTDTPERSYDIVLAMESLAVVDRFTDLVHAMKTAHGFLEPGGLLLAIFGHYERETDDIKAMQAHKISGSLNPDITMFVRALGEAGFMIEDTRQVPVDYPGYLYSGMCAARRA